jgi:hypothetical protein
VTVRGRVLVDRGHALGGDTGLGKRVRSVGAALASWTARE